MGSEEIRQVKLVIHPPVDQNRLAKIEAAAGEMAVVNCPDEPAALAEMPEADAFFGKLTRTMLAASTRLQWVQSPTASLEHYVFPELVEHPCTLTNMRGLFSDNIADHVFGYMLCFARNFHTYVRRQTEARWAPVGGETGRAAFATGPAFLTPIDLQHQSLADQTLGIIGYGAIGREVGRRGAAFGMRVVAVDPVPQEAGEGIELWPAQWLNNLLGASDYVVVCAPHTPDTEGAFGAGQFGQMKSSAYMINIGRGAIVKLADLVAALEAGEIAGAGLDVYETEPLPADSPLWAMENVILTPHVAGYSPRIAERHLAVIVENVGRFVRGETLTNIADKAKWF